MNISSSKLVIEALSRHAGIEFPAADGIPSPEDTHCGACGVAIPQGERLVRIMPNSTTFTDWQYLAHPTLIEGRVPVCQHCAPLFTGTFLSHQARASAAVYSADGAWMLTLDAERMALLLDPPEPPFVAYVATTMGQHVAWRAPVTLDKNLIRIGVGRDSITINRPLLLEASTICRELADSVREQMKNKDGKPYVLKQNHPFISLDRKMESPTHGVIQPPILGWMLERGMQDKIDFLGRLGEGELWGLSVLNKSRQEDPIVTSIKDKLAAKREQAQ